MLAFAPDDRITAFQALNDEWIIINTTGNANSNETNQSNQLSLKNLEAFKVLM
jgi:hypothetical protein